MRRVLSWALIVFLASGAPEVWAATFYVDGASGDDARTPAMAQNSATPWKTLTHALANVTSGDDVQVASGLYDTALGEAYPLELQSGVAIEGAGKATTTLSAPAGSQVFENIDTPLASGTTLTGFTLTHDAALADQSLVHLMPNSVVMEPTIDDNAFVALGSSEYGLFMDTDTESTAARSYGGTISNNTFDGFYVGLFLSADLEAEPGGSFILSPTISGNTFTDNSYAIDVSLDDYQGTSFEDTTKILDNVATGSLENDVYYYADLETGNVSMQPLISGNSFTGSGADSITMSIETLGQYHPSPSGIDVATGSPTISNNTIDHPGGNGIYVVYSYATSSVVMHPEINGNVIKTPGEDGIYFGIYEEFAADPVDLDITIANNTVTDADGDGIHLSGTSLDEYPTFANGTTTIAGNVVDNPGSTGIIDYWSYDYDAYGTLSRVIAGNTVTHSVGEGYGIYAEGNSQSALDAANLEIRDNVVDDGFDAGIYLVYNSWPKGSQVLATCNTLTNNYHGFVVGTAATSTGGSETPDLGGGGSGSPGLNSFYDNIDSDLTANTDDLFAQSNWWGTTNAATIMSHIDGPFAGNVDFSNYLSGPPTVSASNQLTASVSGDVVTYTAVLESTGDCGCASSTFTAPTPDHTSVIPGTVAVSGASGPSVQSEDPLEVLVGALPTGAMVVVTWEVQIDDGYEGDVSAQASFGCTQLATDVASDDPASPGASDPTVVVIEAPAAVDVPTLQSSGLAILVLLLLAAGWFLIDDRRKRMLLTLFLALSLGALGVRAAVRPAGAGGEGSTGPPKSSPTAAPATAPATDSPRAGETAVTTRSERRSLYAAALSHLAVDGKTVRLSLSDGTALSLPRGRVHVAPMKLDRDAKRGMTRAEKRVLRQQRAESKKLDSLRAGQAMVVRFHYAADGSVREVVLRPTADLAAAKAAVTRAETPHAERAARASRPHR